MFMRTTALTRADEAECLCAPFVKATALERLVTECREELVCVLDQRHMLRATILVTARVAMTIFTMRRPTITPKP